MSPSEDPGRFNLSQWALRHRPMVFYLILVFTVLGVLGYQRLGQSEDPPFTFKIMVVRTLWPGASAREVELTYSELPTRHASSLSSRQKFRARFSRVVSGGRERLSDSSVAVLFGDRQSRQGVVQSRVEGNT